MAQTYDMLRKKREKKEKEIFTYKAQALIEFINFANSKTFLGRFKIAWNILFKKIKIVHGKGGEQAAVKK